MRLLRVNIIKADTCGGLLDGLDIRLRTGSEVGEAFDPLCLIGPNGAGKSQFLQMVAEIFQSAIHAQVPGEERLEGNAELEFEVEYLIRCKAEKSDSHVKISRVSTGKKRAEVIVEELSKGDPRTIERGSDRAIELLPKKIVGYTSGGNETMSLPFWLSRSGYAADVAARALSSANETSQITNPRLMLIDYSTHLEVLAANLLLSTPEHRQSILEHARVDDLHSFRCIIQLAHLTRLKAPKGKSSSRKGIQLTAELEDSLKNLQRCATCHHYEPKTERYTFDFYVDTEMSKAFGTFWRTAFDLFSSLHKLAMLNDLAVQKQTRERFRKETKSRRFATRLPEPQDEDKVFRFEQVSFRAKGGHTVDYVSLSDGEHQMAQLLGTFCMISEPNVLFLLDEPESHFNPQWRVEFVKDLLNLPTCNGLRREPSEVSRQDALMTTHAPFVPSDMKRDRVLIFGKDEETGEIEVRIPEIETFGTTFDAILDECFGVRPPISQESRDEIARLKKSDDPDEIRAALGRLGFSVEKAFLADRLRQLIKEREG
jgi:restriction system-associated AAA family ATPase